MARLDWSEFVGTFAAAHCVSLEVAPEADTPVTNMRQVTDIVKRLLREQMRPGGAWAVQLSRQSGAQLLQCAFAGREDADQFAALTNAADRPGPGAWSSHRMIQLDGVILDLLAARAGPPDKGRQRRPRRKVALDC